MSVQRLRARITDISQRVPAKKQQVSPPAFSIVNVAEADMRMGLFKEALVHFRLAIKKCRPLQACFFIGAARAALKINKTHYAQQICEEGIKYFSQDIILYQQLILSLEAQKNFDAALLVLKNIQQKFPSSPYAWLKTAKIYLQIGNYEQANDVLKEAVCLFPENKDVFLEFAKLPLLTQDKNIWNESLERYSMFCHKFDLSYDNYKIALQDVYKVMKLNKDSDFYR